MKKHTSSFIIVTIVLALALLACSTAGQPTPTAGQTGEINPTAQTGQANPTAAQTEQAGSATASATNIPSATDTPSVTNTPTCTPDSSWVADVTIPDNTPFTPGSAFVKTWRVQNSGNCDWPAGTKLVYVSGDPLGGPTSVDVPAVAVGANVDINVNFVAPNAPGTYRSNWQMQEPDGVRFGNQFYVLIIVPEPTLIPTVPPPPTDTPPQPTRRVIIPNLPTTQPPAEWSLYRQGDQGPVVAALQYLLKAEGYSLSADGSFGPQTNTAVRNFQQAKGLGVDGIVGPNTWTALIQGHTVRSGSNGDDVRAVQHILREAYGYDITVDGAFGNQTNTAVRAFQEAHGLAVDGIVGQNTWKALTAK